MVVTLPYLYARHPDPLCDIAEKHLPQNGDILDLVVPGGWVDDYPTSHAIALLHILDFPIGNLIQVRTMLDNNGSDERVHMFVVRPTEGMQTDLENLRQVMVTYEDAIAAGIVGNRVIVDNEDPGQDGFTPLVFT